MRIVIAPDKFKGSLTTPEVVRRLVDGIRSVAPDAQLITIPMADGGEGTIDAAVGAGFELRTATVSGPTGEPVAAAFAVRGREAFVEMAQASGLAVLPGGIPDALGASTRGTGELIRAALDAGCNRVVLGVGGSATTDGGAGLLQGLGVRLLDADGAELPGGGAALSRLASIDLGGLDPRVADTDFILASDVDNPLLGPTGAAAVFAPQKGASAADVAVLEAGLARFVAVLGEALTRRNAVEDNAVGDNAAGDNAVEDNAADGSAAGDGVAGDGAVNATAAGAGAAGGTGFAALTVLRAIRRPGIDVVLELTDLAERMRGADLVITGEGSLDTQTLFGKTPIGVERVAAEQGIPVWAVCGRTLLTAEQLRAAGFERTFALTDLEPDAATCIRDAGPLLEALGVHIATARWSSSERQRAYRDPRNEVSIRPRAAYSTHRLPTRPTEDPSPSYNLVIRGAGVLVAEESGTRIIAAEVGVRDGVIAAIEPSGVGLHGRHVVELAPDEILLPGLVDTHVHVNEPGRTEWEGFASATRAAAAGGVTTIIDMPLNSIPPTTTVSALELKRRVAADQIFVDVGFWGGAIPGNGADLLPLYDEGVFGFKCFLLDSGVEEFPPLGTEELRDDMATLATVDARMIVHAEDPGAIERAPDPAGPGYDNFLASRPAEAENTGIATVIAGARATGVRAHILHLSSADALPEIAAARSDGVALTVETCPHYLTLTAEHIPDGATAYKCCPPIRGAENQDRLWAGLLDGTIDCIVSDHSPSTRALKQPPGGDFGEAWGGISSLQLGLPLVWTEAKRRGIRLEQVVGWMARTPADLVGLTGKGRIAIGAAADFAIFAPEETFTVDASTLQHKNAVCAYDGQTLHGVVRATYLHGARIDSETPTGRLIRRAGVSGLRHGDHDTATTTRTMTQTRKEHTDE
ncbi:MAG: allantoinase AllB [Microbacteriaceae bacterium]|nr:MAG: allantoinase AllB [Microbacteriaceae bacterium]